MNLINKIKNLEKSIKPDEVPPAIYFKYSILGLERNDRKITIEEAREYNVYDMMECFNLSEEKARDYMSRIPVHGTVDFDLRKII